MGTARNSSSLVMEPFLWAIAATFTVTVIATATAVYLRCSLQSSTQNPCRPAIPVNQDDEIPFMQQAPLCSQKGPPPSHIKIEHHRISDSAMIRRAHHFASLMDQRRSIRFYSEESPPLEVLNQCIRCAGTAPSGAHCQPWQFVLVRNQQVKSAIRDAVEEEEQKNYDSRMRRGWVEDCQPLVGDLHDGDTVRKPYLSEAPYLVVVMKVPHGIGEDGERIEHYYAEQSVGIAVGLFLAALTNVGLVTLTSTPMGAEKKIRALCGRPDHEKVFLLMPIGFAGSNATVPYRDEQTVRKPLASICPFVA